VRALAFEYSTGGQPPLLASFCNWNSPPKRNIRQFCTQRSGFALPRQLQRTAGEAQKEEQYLRQRGELKVSTHRGTFGFVSHVQLELTCTRRADGFNALCVCRLGVGCSRTCCTGRLQCSKMGKHGLKVTSSPSQPRQHENDRDSIFTQSDLLYLFHKLLMVRLKTW
jgi:hypothetical protein